MHARRLQLNVTRIEHIVSGRVHVAGQPAKLANQIALFDPLLIDCYGPILISQYLVSQKNSQEDDHYLKSSEEIIDSMPAWS